MADHDATVSVRAASERGATSPEDDDDVRSEHTIPGVDAPVIVARRGAIGEADLDYALGRIAALVPQVPGPLLLVRLLLAVVGDPARDRPAEVKAELDVNGTLLRAHVAGHDMQEAADLLQLRLRSQLEHLAERQHAHRAREAGGEPRSWHHGDLPTARPPYFDRPVDERDVVRRAVSLVDPLAADEAASDLELVDDDFQLFRELTSDLDAVIERVEDGYRLARVRAVPVPLGPTAVPIELAAVDAPRLTLAEAIERLDAGGERFVFFVEPTTDRGNVVYRRYDGHYGHLVPA
jgi:ribosome-associated translation inhibitor RaiA